MRRIVIATCTTATSLVLLLSWSTSLKASAVAAPLDAADAGTPSSGASTPSTTPAPAPASAPAAGAAPAPAPANATTTYDGTTASTQYGPVQVRITVTGGKVSAAQAIQLPTGNSRDHQINAVAIPTLNTEAVAAQSARISMASGATYTSGGYVKSLQSALDKAGI
jgi:uncharacterized protein with FMN-binding domain